MTSLGDDATLMKIAVFGFAMTTMVTALVSVMMVSADGDYDYDEIKAYRDDLISFSGDSMINQSPWVLKHVYTPWNNTLDPATHTDPDGWLYGNEITDYADLNKSAGIKLDPSKKSSVTITYTEDVASYEVRTGQKWWAFIPLAFGWDDPGWYNYETKIADQWNYTGYRYVFDPTLPFHDEVTTSTRDGALSLVWYTYNGQEGLSGGLDVYGGNVLLGSYSATDIIADYNDTSSYATVYDFDFEGTKLTLSIKFDPAAIESGTPLIEAWTSGQWSMAISSLSAGNFFDIKNSTTYTATAGNMISTFTQIFTFSMPGTSSPWMDMLLWLAVGLPFTIAMLCVTLRLVEAAKPF